MCAFIIKARLCLFTFLITVGMSMCMRLAIPPSPLLNSTTMESLSTGYNTCAYMTTNLSLGEFMYKIQHLQERLYANYSKKYQDGSFPPPQGSTLNVGMDKSGYAKHVMVTKVYIFMVTDRIVKMDIEGQSLVMVVDEYLSWNDEALSWKMSLDEIGLPDINLQAKKIWTPPIISSNILDKKSIRDLEEVKVYCDGTCESSRRVQYTIPCSINVEKFPFDRHNCSLRLSHPDNSHSRIAFYHIINDLPGNETVNLVYDHHEEHLEWELLDGKITVISSSLGEPEALEYMLMLRRRATFYFTVLILPCIVLNVLSLTVFTLPIVDAGRMDFVLALILTYFVLIMIVVESSPPSGNQIPLLGLYIILSTAVVGTTYGMSMVLIEMHEHCRMKKKEMPRYLSRFLEQWCCLSRRYATYKKRKGIKDGGGKVIQNARSVAAKGGRNPGTGETAESDCVSADKMMEEGFKWKVLGKVLNVVFFILVCMAHLIVSLVIFQWY